MREQGKRERRGKVGKRYGRVKERKGGKRKGGEGTGVAPSAFAPRSASEFTSVCVYVCTVCEEVGFHTALFRLQ